MSALEQHVPDGFRQSEIGIFPTDWKIDSLAEISTKITDGTHDTPKPIKEGIPFLTAIHVKENYIAFESCYFLPKSVHDEIYKRCNPEYEDILMVNIGAGTGTTALVNVKYPFSLKNVALIKPDKKVSDGRFLNQVLSFLKDEILESLSAGGAQPFLSLSQIGQINVPTPSKEEQTTIANALSDVDALLTELEKLIAKKQAIKTATMQQLLTGKTRLPPFATYTEGEKQGQPKGTKPSELGEIPEDWDVQTVYELAEGQKSLFDDGDWIEAEYITDKGVRLIQTGNIGVGRYQEKENKKYVSESSFIKLKCKELKQGDLLICRLAEPAGRACIFPDIGEEKIITSVDVTIFRPPVETVNREYLLHYFSTNEWFSSVLEQVGGTTHKRISRGALGRIRVPMAKLAEQTAIATILSDMDNEIQTLEQRLAKTRQIKQGMMQELLTGRTRLPFDKD